jgi:hypothetical protein
LIHFGVGQNLAIGIWAKVEICLNENLCLIFTSIRLEKQTPFNYFHLENPKKMGEFDLQSKEPNLKKYP